MIDITGPKVLVPTLLFALLSPGLLFNIPVGPLKQVLFHSLIHTFIYWVIAKFIVKVNMTTADLIVPAILFVVLTPGVLLTIPPGSGGVFMSGQTNPMAVGVHSLLFAVIFATLRTTFSKYY
jgi:Protein of unknown function (DUF3339)